MRYAIYYTPEPSTSLFASAASWLGRDALLNDEVDISHGFGNLVSSPRRYGFHGTLKAPFVLAKGAHEKGLLEEFLTFASSVEPFEIPKIELSKLGSFFALVPSQASPQLQALADKCVTVFEPFRAPLAETDIARRNPHLLSQAQRENLDNWGYPYVFDEFRFHMTLSNSLGDDTQPDFETALKKHFREEIDKPLSVTSIAIFHESGKGEPFKILSLAKLGSSIQQTMNSKV